MRVQKRAPCRCSPTSPSAVRDRASPPSGMARRIQQRCCCLLPMAHRLCHLRPCLSVPVPPLVSAASGRPRNSSEPLNDNVFTFANAPVDAAVPSSFQQLLPPVVGGGAAQQLVASFVLHAESSLIDSSRPPPLFTVDAAAAATISAIALSRGLSCTRPGRVCGGKLIPVTADVSESS